MEIPKHMHAMLFEGPGKALRLAQIPVPTPNAQQILLRVQACGVCRTDLHVIDGDLRDPKLPLILGHEVVGRVVAAGADVQRFQVGDRVGVPWLGHTCGNCRYCLAGSENLCDAPEFTGYTLDGGYAEYMLAYDQFCLPIPPAYEDSRAAPLLCAGLIGYRTFRLAGDAVEALGIYGFGAAAHIISQIATHSGKRVYAFTKPGDAEGQSFARRLGAVWAGGSDENPPEELDAAMIFAPVGSLMVEALKNIRKGGTVVSGGIHMSEIPAFPYRLLWGERMLRSVANLTRQDGEEFMDVVQRIPINTEVQVFPLEQANAALDQLRAGRIEGAAVLSTRVT